MTKIQLKRAKDLNDADWSLWSEIQCATAAYESPYFHPAFTRAVADVRDDVEVAVITECNEAVGFFPFQRGSFNLGKPVGGKLSDYHAPILSQNVALDPRALLRACRLVSWDFEHLVTNNAAFEPFIALRETSPQLDVSSGYEAYSQARRQAGSDTLHRQGQKTRKMAREVGPLQFDYDADDQEAFDLLREWKSSQYIRTGLVDVFSFAWTLELLAKLRENRGEEFTAPLSVLRVGGRVAAVCLSLRCRGVLHSWFTAYNPELQAYSPGLTLFIRLAEEAQGLGINTIDLGRGSERYKWSLASRSVGVGQGSVTCPSLATLLRASWRQTRDWAAKSPFGSQTNLPARLLKPVRAWLAYH